MTSCTHVSNNVCFVSIDEYILSQKKLHHRRLFAEGHVCLHHVLNENENFPLMNLIPSCLISIKYFFQHRFISIDGSLLK